MAREKEVVTEMEDKKNTSGCEPEMIDAELVVTRDENGVHLSLKHTTTERKGKEISKTT